MAVGDIMQMKINSDGLFAHTKKDCMKFSVLF
jgi:hypothetical protein